jgi:hypothetical protein
MISRRQLLQGVLAASALSGLDGRAMAQSGLTQEELLRFPSFGNVTLVHLADIHAQMMPLYFREPSVNIGVGEAKGLVPHLTGKPFLDRFAIAAGSADTKAGKQCGDHRTASVSQVSGAAAFHGPRAQRRDRRGNLLSAPGSDRVLGRLG